MRNGDSVAEFERAFAEYVGARYAIALCNGTATIHTALAALRPDVGEYGQYSVAVPPLTMSATTIAVLHAGGVPKFVDVDPLTWTMEDPPERERALVPVSLYGLSCMFHGDRTIVDAAQTLAPHHVDKRFSPPAFTSYSFQASKILALGEGGMLVTNDEVLARRAREFSSLGYSMAADQPRINPAVLKHPTYARHHSLGWNYRMADHVAFFGTKVLTGDMPSDEPTLLLRIRRTAAHLYREAVAGCPWIKPQYVPDGWTHDYWAFAVALESAELWEPFTEAIVRHGGEMPYGAWRLTYHEPAFRHLAEDGCCPVAEDLQPRLVQFQTNNIASAHKNADAVALAIQEIG